MLNRLNIEILHIYDSEINYYAINSLLKKEGFSVKNTALGEDGLKLALQQPNLIILGIKLADISGFEICRRLKANIETATIPVLYLSSKNLTPEVKAKILESGGEAYLKESGKAIELIANIRALLQINDAETKILTAINDLQSNWEAIANNTNNNFLLNSEAIINKYKQSLNKLSALNYPIEPRKILINNDDQQNRQDMEKIKPTFKTNQKKPKILRRKLTKAKLRPSEYHLLQAQKIAHLGSWEFNIKTQKFIWSEETFRIFGLHPSQGEPNFFQYIHEQIYPHDKDKWLLSFSHALIDGQPYKLEYRILTADNCIKYVVSNCQVNYNEKNQVISLVGTILDISDRYEAEAALIRSHNFMQTINDNTPQIIYILNIWENKTVYINQQITKILGYTIADIYNNNSLWLQNIIHPEDLKLSHQNYEKIYHLDENQVNEMLYRIKHQNGQWRCLLFREVIFTKTPNGYPKEILGTATDITNIINNIKNFDNSNL